MSRTLAVVAALAFAGCSGPFVKVAAVPPADFQGAERSEGSGCGFLLFDLIPIAVNDRLQRGYDEAVRRAEATALADAEITTRWYYAGFGTVVCTDVAGTAIR
jgi:hypothetical protein